MSKNIPLQIRLEEETAIDFKKACDYLGLTRSDYLRKNIEELIKFHKHYTE